MTTFQSALSVTVLPGGGMPVLLVAGIPDQPGEVGFLMDGPYIRTLWRVRGLPVRLTDRPLAPGQPSLAAILRGAIQPFEAAHE